MKTGREHMRRVTAGKAKGTFFVTLSYLMWGILPMFWKLLDKVPSLYILSARIVWSLIFCILYLSGQKKWGRMREICKDRQEMFRCVLAGIAICINWGVYIWAVTNGHLLDSSLGYYMNPVFSVLLGVLCFREKLTKREWLAVLCTGVGVLYLVIRSGAIPMLALVIAGSFTAYGAVSKSISVSSDESLFLETLTVVPFAFIYMIYGDMNGLGAVGVLQKAEWLLLPMAGIVTALPLLAYSAGVKKIPFYLTGMLMYLNPTMQFLLGVFFYKEEINRDKVVAFVFIWAGVLLMLTKGRQKNNLVSESDL